MSTRRDRFVSRSFRAFIYAIVFTLFVAILGFLLVGRQYDASTWFGPTDQAMRRVVNAGNESGAQPVLTNNERSEEARRIAYGASNQQAVGRAVYFLANAPALRQALELRDLETTGAPDYDAVATAVADRVNELEPGIDIRTWKPKEGDDNPIAAIERRTGIPVGLWTEFVYLDLKLDYYNVSREMLRPERLPVTVANLARRVTPEIGSVRDIVLSVRHRDPRMAEILVNAITATYKHQYDTAIIAGALKQLQFYRERQAVAAHRYDRSRSAPDPQNSTYISSVAVEALNEATRNLRRADEEFSMIEASGSLIVLCWAGVPPGTANHPESPAREGATKRNIVLLTSVFLLGFVGSLGFSYTLGTFKREVAEIRNRPAETAETEPSAIEPLEDSPVAEPVAESEGENAF